MKILRHTLFFAAAVAAAVSFTRADPVDPTPAPAWSLKDLDGKTVSSADFKGKVLVVDFWATWCGPCRHEIPSYIDLQKKYGKDGLVIVGIAVNDSADRVKKFAKEAGMNYVVLLDDDSGTPDKFGNIEAIPTTFIIDRDGNIRDRKTGSEDTATYEQTLLPYLKNDKA